MLTAADHGSVTCVKSCTMIWSIKLSLPCFAFQMFSSYPSGLFLRWISEINPVNLANVPSGRLSEVNHAVRTSLTSAKQSAQKNIWKVHFKIFCLLIKQQIWSWRLFLLQSVGQNRTPSVVCARHRTNHQGPRHRNGRHVSWRETKDNRPACPGLRRAGER